MENSPKIGVKGFIYRMLDAGQRILEMQIAGGGLAVGRTLKVPPKRTLI